MRVQTANKLLSRTIVELSKVAAATTMNQLHSAAVSVWHLGWVPTSDGYPSIPHNLIVCLLWHMDVHGRAECTSFLLASEFVVVFCFVVFLSALKWSLDFWFHLTAFRLSNQRRHQWQWQWLRSLHVCVRVRVQLEERRNAASERVK